MDFSGVMSFLKVCIVIYRVLQYLMIPGEIPVPPLTTQETFKCTFFSLISFLGLYYIGSR